MNWSFYQVWNESLEKRTEREYKPRNNLWASELGNSTVDLFLKMKGVTPSNPPDPRSLRKFEAGNIWEWVVGLVLKRAGILIESQEWVSFQYDGLLEVTGKLDFLAGGKPDWDKALNDIKSVGLPDFLTRASDDIITYLKIKYPDGLNTVVLENKSCSSFMFERYSKTDVASDNHVIQCFHYLKSKGLSEGHILYVSKDDARIMEIGVSNPGPAEEKYRQAIEKITNYIKADERPPLEAMVVFDEDWGRFSDNWRVKYSNYLTMLYGFENQNSFENTWKKRVSQWNRVLGRCVRGDTMTKLNLEIIDDIKKYFINFDDLVSKVKQTGITPEEGDDNV